jgi:hypothetical protein
MDKWILSIGLLLGIGGIVPYLLDKRGIAVPDILILWGGIAAIIGVAACLYYPFYPLPWPAIPLALLTGIAMTWWWMYPGQNNIQWNEERRQTIVRKNYANEIVKIDGRVFDHCKFINVTLLYEGEGPVTFIESQFSGSTVLQTPHPAINTYVQIQTWLLSSPNVAKSFIAEKDESGNLRILSRSPDPEKAEQKNPNDKKSDTN